MKNRDIYNAALKLLNESAGQGENEDFEERAPYIIAVFCSESRESDAAYRRANSLPAAKEVNDVYVDLDDDFARSPRFASAACVYLASMLILDDNYELSDKLFDRYSDMMSRIVDEIPASIESIARRYI
jgi:hypothetical protein